MKAKAIALTISLVFVSVALGFQDNPQMGTWKLNETKSQTKVTVDGVDENGNAVHNEWTGKFDGKPYAVTGDANSDMRSYRMMDKNTLELKGTKGGKPTINGSIVVSGDGKTRTVTTTTTDAQGKKIKNVAVYDKQ
jgi:hypothetical protein